MYLVLQNGAFIVLEMPGLARDDDASMDLETLRAFVGWPKSSTSNGQPPALISLSPRVPSRSSGSNETSFPPEPITTIQTRILKACIDAGFVPDARHYVSNAAAMLTMVSCGTGIAVVPESMQSFKISNIQFPAARQTRGHDRNRSGLPRRHH
jgi:hypothetical protein